MTQEQIGRTGLQSGEGKQLESSGGEHILNSIFLLQEAGMGPQGRDLTLFLSPFEQEQHGPIDSKCYIPSLPLPYLISMDMAPSTSIPHQFF